MNTERMPGPRAMGSPPAVTTGDPNALAEASIVSRSRTVTTNVDAPGSELRGVNARRSIPENSVSSSPTPVPGICNWADRRLAPRVSVRRCSRSLANLSLGSRATGRPITSR